MVSVAKQWGVLIAGIKALEHKIKIKAARLNREKIKVFLLKKGILEIKNLSIYIITDFKIIEKVLNIFKPSKNSNGVGITKKFLSSEGGIRINAAAGFRFAQPTTS